MTRTKNNGSQPGLLSTGSEAPNVGAAASNNAAAAAAQNTTGNRFSRKKKKRTTHLERLKECNISEELRMSITLALKKLETSEDQKELELPSSLTAEERKYIHIVAQQMGFKSKSRGGKLQRSVTISKRDPDLSPVRHKSWKKRALKYGGVDELLKQKEDRRFKRELEQENDRLVELEKMKENDDKLSFTSDSGVGTDDSSTETATSVQPVVEIKKEPLWPELDPDAYAVGPATATRGLLDQGGIGCGSWRGQPPLRRGRPSSVVGHHPYSRGTYQSRGGAFANRSSYMENYTVYGINNVANNFGNEFPCETRNSHLHAVNTDCGKHVNSNQVDPKSKSISFVQYNNRRNDASNILIQNPHIPRDGSHLNMPPRLPGPPFNVPPPFLTSRPPPVHAARPPIMLTGGHRPIHESHSGLHSMKNAVLNGQRVAFGLPFNRPPPPISAVAPREYDYPRTPTPGIPNYGYVTRAAIPDPPASGQESVLRSQAHNAKTKYLMLPPPPPPTLTSKSADHLNRIGALVKTPPIHYDRIRTEGVFPPPIPPPSSDSNRQMSTRQPTGALSTLSEEKYCPTQAERQMEEAGATVRPVRDGNSNEDDEQERKYDPSDASSVADSMMSDMTDMTDFSEIEDKYHPTENESILERERARSSASTATSFSETDQDMQSCPTDSRASSPADTISNFGDESDMDYCTSERSSVPPCTSPLGTSDTESEGHPNFASTPNKSHTIPSSENDYHPPFTSRSFKKKDYRPIAYLAALSSTGVDSRCNTYKPSTSRPDSCYSSGLNSDAEDEYCPNRSNISNRTDCSDTDEEYRPTGYSASHGKYIPTALSSRSSMIMNEKALISKYCNSANSSSDNSSDSDAENEYRPAPYVATASNSEDDSEDEYRPTSSVPSVAAAPAKCNTLNLNNIASAVGVILGTHKVVALTDTEIKVCAVDADYKSDIDNP